MNKYMRYRYLLAVALTLMWLTTARAALPVRDLSGGILTDLEQFELARAALGGALAAIVQALSHVMSRRQITLRSRGAEILTTAIIAAVGIGIYVNKIGANLVWEMLIAMSAGLLGARGLSAIIRREAQRKLEGMSRERGGKGGDKDG